MNIDLLSKLIRELMQDYNEVTLPGLGIFVAEYVSASFSDKGFTVNPPYRRLSFRQKPGIDNRLVDHYADSYGISRKAAERELTDFLAEMKSILRQRKSVTFPEMGRLRATKENHFFFVASEDLSICPESFGLQPVSLKALSADVARVATDRFGSELEVAGGENGVIAPESDEIVVAGGESDVIAPESGEIVAAGGESGVIAPENDEVVAAEVAEPAAETEMLADVASEQQAGAPVAPEFVDEQQVEAGLVAEVAESVEAEPVAEMQSEAAEPVVTESEAPEIVVAEVPVAAEPMAEEIVAEEPVAEEPVAAEAECSQEEASPFAKADECEAPAEAAAQNAPADAPAGEPEMQAAAQDVPAEQPEMQTAAQSAPASEPASNASATVAAGEKEPVAEKAAAGNVWWKVLAGVALVVVLFFVTLAVLGRVAPGFVDQFLYTPEEIQIINYFK